MRRLRLWPAEAQARLQMFLAVLVVQVGRDTRGQDEWASTFMKLGIVLLIAGAVFTFWKTGGVNWIGNLFTNMQTL